MAAEESIKSLQEDELQAILAIFDGAVDLRTQDVWKVNNVDCGRSKT